MVGLVDLPVELLLHIHLVSLSSTLPLVSRSFRAMFSMTSPFHKASYLVLRHPSHKTLSHAIRYPICTLAVVRAIERIHLARNGKKKNLKCPQLPRRLFSRLSPGLSPGALDQRRLDDLALVRYLLEEYGASPNSHTGYPLARAVFANDFDLARLLLDHGADPGLKEGWAVVTAIMKGTDASSTAARRGGGGGGGLPVVRALIERDYPLPMSPRSPVLSQDHLPNGGGPPPGGGDGDSGTLKKKRKRDKIAHDDDNDDDKTGSSRAKRAKLEDRCKPTAEMLETAVKTKQWDIVDYLTKKGATPNLNVLKLL